MTNLGPEFDCVHCRRPEFEPEHYGHCPNCPLTISRESFRASAVEEVRDVLRIEPDEQEIARVESLASVVMFTVGETRGRIDPAWSREFAELARAVRYEESRAQAIDHFNRPKPKTR